MSENKITYKYVPMRTLDKINQMKERLINQIGLTRLAEMAKHYDDWNKPVVHGAYYFVFIDNPFGNPYKTSQHSFDSIWDNIETWGDYQYFKSTWPEDDDPIIKCIGRGVVENGKSRIYLYNVYNNSNPAYIEYKEEWKKWYFYNKGRLYYTVEYPKSNVGKPRYPDVRFCVHPTNTKKDYILSPINTDKFFIKNLTDIKTELVKYQEAIDAEETRKREEAEKTKREREAKIAEEQRIREQKAKEYQEFFKDYTYIGYNAPGSTFPDPEYREIYNKACADKESKWDVYCSTSEQLPGHRGRIFSGTYYNKKYKLYYHEAGDSTD